MSNRASFEAWATAQGWSTERADDGGYRSLSTDAGFGAWLACADESIVKHSRACIEWANMCEKQKRHGAKVGATECANMLRGRFYELA